jgi:hypothetical protein
MSGGGRRRHHPPRRCLALVMIASVSGLIAKLVSTAN